jgi:hypothetical protein
MDFIGPFMLGFLFGALFEFWVGNIYDFFAGKKGFR